MDFPAVLAKLQEWLGEEVTVYVGATGGDGGNVALLSGTLAAGFDFEAIEAGDEPHPNLQADNILFWIRPSRGVPTSFFNGFFVARGNLLSAGIDREPPLSLDIHTSDGLTLKVEPQADA